MGVTAHPRQRYMSHMESWRDFDEMRLIKGFSNRLKAEEFEKFAINYFNSPLNILKTPSNFKILKGISADDLARFENPKEKVRFEC